MPAWPPQPSASTTTWMPSKAVGRHLLHLVTVKTWRDALRAYRCIGADGPLPSLLCQ